MKNYISIFRILIGIVCIQLSSVSCSDDFLKPDPLSLYEPSVTFSTVEGLNSALASADKALRAYWTNTEACDLMLPLMSEYLFSDLAVASKTDDALILTNASLPIMVGITSTRIALSSFGERPTMALNTPTQSSVILTRLKDWMKQPKANI